MSRKLTEKQNQFILEYMKDLNATQAAIRAGYSKKTAKVIGHENLTKPYIAERLKKEMDNEEKVKEAKRKEIEFHVRVHEDMQEK